MGTLTINRSTVSGNRTCCEGGQAGGIYNLGTLRVNSSTISGNQAYNVCYYSCLSSGGGIENGGTLIINNSTISGNTAVNKCSKYCVARGAGIDSYGPLFQSNNSTISGNSPSFVGCSAYCFAYAGGINNDFVAEPFEKTPSVTAELVRVAEWSAAPTC